MVFGLINFVISTVYTEIYQDIVIIKDVVTYHVLTSK